MDNKLAGLVGVMGALAVAAPALAAPTLNDAMRADTYADLLRPIPNAGALLAASNALEAEAPEAAPEMMQVQYYRDHHHHHHHNRYQRPYYPVRPVYQRPRYHHHHHHHHHHHNQQRGIGVFIR